MRAQFPVPLASFQCVAQHLPSCFQLWTPFSARLMKNVFCSSHEKCFPRQSVVCFQPDAYRPSTHALSLCLHTMSDSQTPGGVGWGAWGILSTGLIPRQTPALISDSEAACLGPGGPALGEEQVEPADPAAVPASGSAHEPGHQHPRRSLERLQHPSAWKFRRPRLPEPDPHWFRSLDPQAGSKSRAARCQGCGC